MEIPARWPRTVKTLAIDIGGTGLKASVLGPKGDMLVDRVRVETPYPCSPDLLISTLQELIAPLPAAHRATVGFPGLVRNGVVISVPSLSRTKAGGPRVEEQAALWEGYPLEDALATAFSKPLLLANDADVQGCAVVSGQGFEYVMTLGTGVGTSLFDNGLLLPHIELSHAPFRKNESFDIQLGDAERKRIGDKHWNKRVKKALVWLEDVLYPDRIYIGGGNAKRLTFELGPRTQVVSNAAGILGGMKVWERHQRVLHP
jgi:polyphosphate glucokinase